ERKDKKREIPLQQIIDALPQMIFQADANGDILAYNRRWYDYIGDLDLTEGWGWKDKPIHHPEDLDRTVARWKHSVTTVEPYEIEYRLRRHDGEYRWHLGRAMPIKKSTGEVLMWIGTNTDIHDQKTQR
ncbi:MAG: PAS domain S-box protein, partial [Proteobacteria bacterium]